VNTTRIGGLALVVGGLTVLLISALSDVLGLGLDPGFGPWQIAGVVVGGIAIAGGILFLLRGGQARD